MPQQETIEALLDQLKTTTSPDQVELIERKIEILRSVNS